MGINNCPKEEANLGKYGRKYVMFGKLFVTLVKFCTSFTGSNVCQRMTTVTPYLFVNKNSAKKINATHYTNV